MRTLHRILVAVDFSMAARNAFNHALALSRSHNAELRVVHAVAGKRPFNWDGRERARLIASLRRAAEEAAVDLKVSVQHGDPARLIMLHATVRRADLIVLGTSHRSWIDRVRSGSVAETVALAATQPVLVVPSTAHATAEPLKHFNSILVAVDLKDGSDAAVAHALAIANDRSRVTVMHVVPGVPLAGASRYMYGLMEPEYQRQVSKDAWRQIAATIPADARRTRRAFARVVTGDPEAEIGRVAEEVNADLILIGATPRNAIARMVFGSTTARVIRHSRRPVLAIPAAARMTAAVPEPRAAAA